MNRKLKRAVSFHLVSGLVIVTPFLVSILIAIIGATYWNWEGRGFLIMLAGFVVSIVFVFLFFWFMDSFSEEVEEWIKEESKAPKEGAWKI